MVRHSHLLLAVVVATLAAPVAAPAQTAQPQLTRGPARPSVGREAAALPTLTVSGIQGVVMDEESRPLPDVNVRLLGPTTAAATTDLQGFFRITALPPGQYLVRAYAAGYRTATSGVIELASGGGADGAADARVGRRCRSRRAGAAAPG